MGRGAGSDQLKILRRRTHDGADGIHFTFYSLLIRTLDAFFTGSADEPDVFLQPALARPARLWALRGIAVLGHDPSLRLHDDSTLTSVPVVGPLRGTGKSGISFSQPFCAAIGVAAGRVRRPHFQRDTDACRYVF